ncbi:MAG: hypothetical protein ABSF35_22105 [Polyangia bacterium]
MIDRNSLDDMVANLANPQIGDTFTLDTQREASEVVTATSPASVDVNVSTATQPIQGAANVFV